MCSPFCFFCITSFTRIVTRYVCLTREANLTPGDAPLEWVSLRVGEQTLLSKRETGSVGVDSRSTRWLGARAVANCLSVEGTTRVLPGAEGEGEVKEVASVFGIAFDGVTQATLPNATGKIVGCSIWLIIQPYRRKQ